jgi:uncharacterized protein YeaO (DUF488 family)
MLKNSIKVKRVYDDPSAEDGIRILVDRLWPRGLKKVPAKLDDWLKGIAPSDELRKWFGHDPDRWEEFKARYFHELERQNEAINKIKEKASSSTITLLFAARDETHNNAVALREYLEGAEDKA